MKKEPHKIIMLVSCVILGVAALVYSYSESHRSTTTIILNQNPITTETITSSAEITTTEKKKTTAKTTKVIKTEAVKKSTSVVTTVETTEEEDIYIDINTAEFDDFCRLYGIGEHLANAILEYRNDNGRFNNIEEIMNVSGIGEGIFEKIRDCIYVENPYYPDYSENEEEYTEENTDEELIYEDEQEEEKALVLEDFIPININTADKEILMLLPFFDEEAADELIHLREEFESQGGFQNPLELLYMKSITQKQLAEIIDYLTVD